MPLGSSIKHICLSFRSEICFNNLNLVPYIEFFADLIAKGLYSKIGIINFFFAIASLQSEWSNTRELYLLHPASFASHHLYGGFKGLKLYKDQERFLAITQATNLGWS